MRKISWNFIKSKKSVFVLVIAFGLIAISLFNIIDHSLPKKIVNLQEGVNTCFIRVTQTYMAKVVGDLSSKYLSSEFTRATEECFAKAISVAKTDVAKYWSIMGESLNSISSGVYWFHNKLSEVSFDNLNLSFSDLEDRKDNAYEIISTQLYNHLNSRKYINILSGLLLFIIVFLSFLLYFKLEAKKKLKNQLELSATEIINLDLQDNMNKKRVEDIIEQALEQSNFYNVKTLFFNFIKIFAKNRSNDKEFAVIADGKSNVNLLMDNNEKTINDIIDKNWNKDGDIEEIKKDKLFTADNESQSLENVVNLKSLFDKLLEHFSHFKGEIDYNISDGLLVKINYGELQHAIYHILTAFIENINIFKKVIITSKNMKYTVMLDFFVEGESLNQYSLKDWLQWPVPGPRGTEELRTCIEILDRYNCKVDCKKIFNADEQPIGLLVQLQLPIYFEEKEKAKKGKYIRDVKKGTKQIFEKELS